MIGAVLPPPHIAVVGPIAGGSLSIAESCVRALRRLGHRVTFVDNQGYAPALHAIEAASPDADARARARVDLFLAASDATRRVLREARPQLALFLAQAPVVRDSDVADLRAANIPSVFWFVEDFRVFTYWPSAVRRSITSGRSSAASFTSGWRRPGIRRSTTCRRLAIPSCTTCTLPTRPAPTLPLCRSRARPIRTGASCCRSSSRPPSTTKPRSQHRPVSGVSPLGPAFLTRAGAGRSVRERARRRRTPRDAGADLLGDGDQLEPELVGGARNVRRSEGPGQPAHLRDRRLRRISAGGVADPGRTSSSSRGVRSRPSPASPKRATRSPTTSRTSRRGERSPRPATVALTPSTPTIAGSPPRSHVWRSATTGSGGLARAAEGR